MAKEKKYINQTINNNQNENKNGVDEAWEQAWKQFYSEHAMNQTAQNSAKERFSWNKKYLTICLYAILVVIASTFIIKAVVGWESTVVWFKKGVAVIAPFLWGAFIAFLMNPFVRLIDKKIFGRLKKTKKRDKVRAILSIVTAYILVICIIVLVFVFLIPQIGKSIADIVGQIPKWGEQITDWILEFEKNNDQFDFEMINEYIEGFQPQLIEFSKNLVTNVVPLIYTTSVSVVKTVLNVLIAIIVSIYIIADKRILARGFKKILYAVTPDRTGSFIMQTLDECYRIFSQFVFGKAVDSTIIGVLCLIIMTVMKLPFAPLISLIVGITNMIPYFGPFIGAVPGTIFIFMVSPLKALFFVIMIIVIQQFDGLVLGPRILGETVGLRPLWIIFAITIGGSIGGVVGMFLGVPCVAVISYLMDIFINRLLEKKKTKKQKDLTE